MATLGSRVLARHDCDGDSIAMEGTYKDLGPACRCYECIKTVWHVFENDDPADWDLFHPAARRQ